jgi:hypothetical protein
MSNGPDVGGQSTLQYFMPNLPVLMAAGSAGFWSYTTSNVPTLVAEVQCSDGRYTFTNPHFVTLLNGSNNITIGTSVSNEPVIQVSTVTDTVWFCVAKLGMANANASFISDGNGNWNISAINISTSSSVEFSSTPARQSMMTDIISDALGATVDYFNWNWTASNSQSPAYPVMLASTSLTFAAATLAFSSIRAESTHDSAEGAADVSVQKVVLQKNWALYATIVLLFLQALVAFTHMFPGRWQLDFGILQIMEMQRSAGDSGVPLWGYCPRYRCSPPEYGTDFKVAIRSLNGHLGLVLCDDNGNTPGGWRNISNDDKYT